MADLPPEPGKVPSPDHGIEGPAEPMPDNEHERDENGVRPCP